MIYIFLGIGILPTYTPSSVICSWATWLSLSSALVFMNPFLFNSTRVSSPLPTLFACFYPGAGADLAWLLFPRKCLDTDVGGWTVKWGERSIRGAEGEFHQLRPTNNV